MHSKVKKTPHLKVGRYVAKELPLTWR